MTWPADDRPCFYLSTMGCAKNTADSDHMRRQLLAAGFIETDEPSRADIVIVNTCSFIQSACEESIDAVLEATSLPQMKAKTAHLIVVGCLPARYGEELEKELPEVDAFVPCSQEDDIAIIACRCLGIEEDDAEIGEKSEDPADKTSRHQSEKTSPNNLSTSTGANKKSSTFAYVKISEGCNRLCSYCAIPFIRGRYHSFSFDEILHEVENHVSAGAREIVLIAQDTGHWGKDLAQPRTLAWLIKELAMRFPKIWFRIMYIQPEGVTDELLDVMATFENICPYLDIPLQHVCTPLLRAMNRSGGQAEFESLISHIRDKIPQITLRTTLMVGFPGETEEDFEQLCAFVTQGHFDYIGIFTYSQEEGTQAFDMPCQVGEDVKIERARELRDLADTTCAQVIAERCTSSYDVIVESRDEDGKQFGRAMCQAPEVDGVTYVETGNIGDIISVRIENTFLYDMEGR